MCGGTASARCHLAWGKGRFSRDTLLAVDGEEQGRGQDWKAKMEEIELLASSRFLQLNSHKSFLYTNRP